MLRDVKDSRIEECDAFTARERFDIAMLLVKDVHCGGELLDSLGIAVLSLKQRCIPHEPVRGLRERTQETAENRRSLRGIARFDQAIELGTIELSRHARFVQPRVDISKSLQGFGMVGRLLEHSLVAGHSLTKLVFLQASSRPFEIFARVLRQELNPPHYEKRTPQGRRYRR